MHSCFVVKISAHFCAAHIIPNHPGQCKNLHGHNFKMEVEVRASQLDELGMAMDFQKVKDAANALCDKWDHCYLNEVPPFDTLTPTAENIAYCAYQALKPLMQSHHTALQAVTIWESERCCVTYSEEVK
jgi:6-pyruvoyltetrahydropterin/6-carboxytetrahydropterin synthase